MVQIPCKYYIMNRLPTYRYRTFRKTNFSQCNIFHQQTIPTASSRRDRRRKNDSADKKDSYSALYYFLSCDFDELITTFYHLEPLFTTF